MCRPLKDIVAELEAKYEGSELLYDLEERHRIIEDFDKDVDYMFVRLEKFEEDVKFVLEHKMNVNVICRMTLNLTLIMQQMCKSVTDYYYAMEKYLMDERYEKNHDYWSRFIECSQRIQKLSNSLQENNNFGVEMPDEATTIANMYYEEGGIDYTKKISPTGTIFINEREIEKMNGAELLICIWKLMDDFGGSLGKLKNISYSRDTSSLPDIYNRNYLLYAKNYWPAHAEQFRSHIEHRRLRGHVDINGLERLRDEAIHEFEYNTTSGKIWRVYSEDISQMAIQMKETFIKDKKNEDEEMWKTFFQNIFELDEFDRWIEELRNPVPQESGLKKYVLKPEKADVIVGRLRELVDAKDKPILIMKPIRAAIDAGALERPSWESFKYEFGESKIKSKASFSGYTDPLKEPYQDDEGFNVLKEEFEHLISE